jgi:cell division protein FtsL
VATDPIEDLKAKADGLLGWVQQKKAESQKDGTPWGWVMAAVAAVIVFCTLAFAAYDAWKRGREIAKLKHQIDVQEEAKKKAEVDIKLSKETTFQLVQQRFITTMEAYIRRDKTIIAEIEKERQNLHTKIDQITDWSDINKL